MSENEVIFFPTRKVTVEADQDGQRIDNFLLAHLKGVPRSYVYRILRKGEVRVDGGRKKPTYKVKQGEIVRIPPVKMEPQTIINVPQSAYEDLKHAILLETDDFLVLNKPAGLAVHSGSEVSFGVIEIMQQHHHVCDRIDLVHRIDRGTSGCLLLAKNRQTLNALQNQFRHSKIKKSYLAFIQGALRENNTTVRKALTKIDTSEGHRVVVDSEGKAAHSEFILQQTYQSGSLMKVDIHTGRTHQIRVHAQSLGHPLAGDKKYGDKQFNRQCKEAGLNRMFLHASELTFEHRDEVFHVVAPLPDVLSIFLDATP